jgi:hypothetical protein
MSFLRLATSKSSKLVLTLLVIFSNFFVNAQESYSLNPSGSLRSSAWNKDKSFSTNQSYLVSSAWLTLRPDEIFGAKLYLDFFAQGQNFSRDSLAYGDLREGFIEKSFGNFDIKIGRQIIIWGRADKANPTDSFSAKNLTLLSSDDEDQRLGHFATQVIYNLDNYRLIAVWQPEWRNSVFPVKEVAGLTFQNFSPEKPNQQYGFKVDSSGSDVDWSLSYFEGLNRTPDFKILELGAVTKLGLEYNQIKVYGADFATVLGQLGLRGEIALTKTIDQLGDDPLRQNSNMYAVVGADRTLVENFNINAQLLYKAVEQFVDAESIANTSLKPLAVRAASITNQKYKEQFGLSFRPSYKMFNETLEFEVAYISWFKNTDSVLRPKVTYAFSDHFRASLGGDFYNGPEDTLFGQLKDVSSGYFELRYLF